MNAGGNQIPFMGGRRKCSGPNLRWHTPRWRHHRQRTCGGSLIRASGFCWGKKCRFKKITKNKTTNKLNNKKFRGNRGENEKPHGKKSIFQFRNLCQDTAWNIEPSMTKKTTKIVCQCKRLVLPRSWETLAGVGEVFPACAQFSHKCNGGYVSMIFPQHSVAFLLSFRINLPNWMKQTNVFLWLIVLWAGCKNGTIPYLHRALHIKYTVILFTKQNGYNFTSAKTLFYNSL